MVLGVGGVTESVDVVGESPVVDVASSSTDNTLSQDLLFNLPIRPDERRDRPAELPARHQRRLGLRRQRRLRQRAPRSTASTPATPTAGSAWTFFNYNLVEEVQVGGLGAPAEYGAYTGAVVNTLTKSGGNRYTGLFDVYWTKNELLRRQRPARVRRRRTPRWTTRPSIDKRLDLTGQLGGPLIKDKLFFFVAAQRYEQTDNPSGAIEDVHTEVSPRFNTKLTWQPGPNDNLSLNFQWDNYNQTGRCDYRATPSCSQQITVEPGLARGDLGPAVAAPLRHADVRRGQVHRLVGLLLPRPEGARPHLLRRTTQALLRRRRVHDYARPDPQPGERLDLALRRGLRQARPEVRPRDRAQQGAQPLRLRPAASTTTTTPSTTRRGSTSPTTTATTPRAGTSASRSTPRTPGSPPSGSRSTPACGSTSCAARAPCSTRRSTDNTNWAPRLGFAFDLTGDGKTVLKGHYGQYYEGIFFDALPAAVPGFRRLRHLRLRPGGRQVRPARQLLLGDRPLPEPVYGVDPDMKHPRVDEWTAGIERELAKDVRLSVTGIWRQDKNVQALASTPTRAGPRRR